MFLKNLKLQDFRSFKKEEFSFGNKVTMLIGPNAIGKTNILEAIYLLATGKSFHAGKEEEMIGYEGDIAFVKGAVLLRSIDPKFFSSVALSKNISFKHESLGEPLTTKKENFVLSSRKTEALDLEIILTRGEVQGKRTARKIYKVNGVGKSWRDFAGNLKVVIFRPEDIDLVLGPPSLRRNYLDGVLELVDWQYRVCSLTYKKALRQRNRVLDKIRDNQALRSQLTFWDQLLIKNGMIISDKRQELIDFYNEKLGFLKLEYDKSLISEKRLEQYSEAEVALGQTLVGPHRDDFKLQVTGDKLEVKRDLSLYGSRGEQRMAVLQLKLKEMEFIIEKTSEQPILLLDDIFSELDRENRKLVLQIINDFQVIMTSTEVIKEIKGKIDLINLA